MTVLQQIDRRQAQRFQANFQVRVSINGGPEFISETLNFTSKSLAVRSDVEARKGDKVVVRFGDLPSIDGEVARVFPEGFAVVLSAQSLAMMANHQGDAAEQADISAHSTGELKSSSVFRVTCDRPARAQITTAVSYRPGYNRHFLTLMVAGDNAFDDVQHFWLTADGARWMTRAVKIERRGNYCAAYLVLNDWQIHMGAAYGLEISIASGEMKDLRLAIEPQSVADHFAAFEDFKLAVGA
ncbi:MAG: hypothetical protein R3C58_08215 [Parvularculaceae bacterium]